LSEKPHDTQNHNSSLSASYGNDVGFGAKSHPFVSGRRARVGELAAEGERVLLSNIQH
jgi:hypothetical protein